MFEPTLGLMVAIALGAYLAVTLLMLERPRTLMRTPVISVTEVVATLVTAVAPWPNVPAS